MLSVLIASPDRRIVTPAEIAADPAANAESPTLAVREALSDDVSAKLVALYQGREPWRQTYAEQMLDWEGSWLRPTRYPIEDTPTVWLGSSALSAGLYRVEGRCRHTLRRDPNVAYAAASSGIPLSSAVSPNLAPFETGGSTNAADFRLPSYVAGYVPPDSINPAWIAATAYAPGESMAYADTVGSWIKSTNPAGQLLFECTTAGTSHAATTPTLPLSLTEYAPNVTHTDGLQWLAPPDSLLVFEETTPGTSGTEAPTWPTTAGNTVSAVGGTAVWTARTQMDITDGTVTWTGRNAREFPRGIRKAALLMARIIRVIDLDGQCDKEAEKMATIMHLLEGSC